MRKLGRLIESLKDLCEGGQGDKPDLDEKVKAIRDRVDRLLTWNLKYDDFPKPVDLGPDPAGYDDLAQAAKDVQDAAAAVRAASYHGAGIDAVTDADEDFYWAKRRWNGYLRDLAGDGLITSFNDLTIPG